MRFAAERVPLAIVSGAARAEIEPVVEAAGLTGCFEAIVPAEDVEHGKPHPDGYLRALELLDGGLDAGDVLVFEDTEAGVASAKAAGMRCFAVLGTLSPERLSQADEIVERIDPPAHAAALRRGVRPLVLAHRGACWEVPENTLEAFELAIAEEADYVEFDVRARNGQLVICHDPGPPEDVPTLEEVLDALTGRVGLCVEVKEEETTDAVLDALERHAVDPDELLVVSFAGRRGPARGGAPARDPLRAAHGRPRRGRRVLGDRLRGARDGRPDRGGSGRGARDHGLHRQRPRADVGARRAGRDGDLY